MFCHQGVLSTVKKQLKMKTLKTLSVFLRCRHYLSSLHSMHAWDIIHTHVALTCIAAITTSTVAVVHILAGSQRSKMYIIIEERGHTNVYVQILTQSVGLGTGLQRQR